MDIAYCILTTKYIKKGEFDNNKADNIRLFQRYSTRMRQISMTKMDPLARIWKGDRVL
jgi:hypothetical protein